MNIEFISKELLTSISLLCIPIAFWKSMRELEENKGAEYASMAIGVWTDILLVLFPFLIYFFIGWWINDIDTVLASPEIAMAATVLSGQGLLKYFRCFLSAKAHIKHIERAVWITVLALFVFAFSLVIVVLIVVKAGNLELVSYIQPPLLLLSVLLYFATSGTAEWALKVSQANKN